MSDKCKPVASDAQERSYRRNRKKRDRDKEERQRQTKEKARKTDSSALQAPLLRYEKTTTNNRQSAFLPLSFPLCKFASFSPNAVEDEKQLNKDAAKGQDAAHEHGGQGACVNVLRRDLARNLVCPHRLSRCIGKWDKNGVRNCRVEVEWIEKGYEQYCTMA